jgi:hypothetical protein
MIIEIYFTAVALVKTSRAGALQQLHKLNDYIIIVDYSNQRFLNLCLCFFRLTAEPGN